MFKRTGDTVSARLLILLWGVGYGALVIFLGYCVVAG